MLAKVMTQRMDLIQNTKTNDNLYLGADLPYVRWIQKATPLKALRASTERMLWHQRLGHPSGYYLYTAHKFIDGVPEFKTMIQFSKNFLLAFEPNSLNLLVLVIQ